MRRAMGIRENFYILSGDLKRSDGFCSAPSTQGWESRSSRSRSASIHQATFRTCRRMSRSTKAFSPPKGEITDVGTSVENQVLPHDALLKVRSESDYIISENS